MAQIRSSSAELIAFFETGDVPTADQFSDLIYSTAVYDGTLPYISASATGTGSFPYLIAPKITSTGSGLESILAANFIPDSNNTYNIGSDTKLLKKIFVVTSSIGVVSSSLIPEIDNTWDLGSSTFEWKDLYIDGTAYIDTLSISALDNDVSITGISASGQILNVSGNITPHTTNIFDLGSTDLLWSNLYSTNVSSSKVSSSIARIDTAEITTIGAATDTTTDAYITTATVDVLASSGGLDLDITLSGSLVPGSDKIVSIGSDTKLIKVVHALTSSTTVVSSSLIPTDDNIWDLGADGIEWKDLYIDGIAYIDSASVDVLDVSSEVSSSLIPGADDTWDLGSSGNEWKDLYIDGTANLDTAAIGTGSIDRLSSNLIPTADSSLNLGSSTFRFNQIHTISSSVNISASLSAVRFQNLPTSEDQARLIGSGSLYLGNASGSNSKYLVVFTGGN